MNYHFRKKKTYIINKKKTHKMKKIKEEQKDIKKKYIEHLKVLFDF